jgi:hypothetical protein
MGGSGCLRQSAVEQVDEADGREILVVKQDYLPPPILVVMQLSPWWGRSQKIICWYSKLS